MKFWLCVYVSFWGTRCSSLGRMMDARDEVWEAADVVYSARIVLR